MRVALLNIPENRKSAACPPSEEDAQTAPRPLREALGMGYAVRDERKQRLLQLAQRRLVPFLFFDVID